jgi:hypothetical protein
MLFLLFIATSLSAKIPDLTPVLIDLSLQFRIIGYYREDNQTIYNESKSQNLVAHVITLIVLISM